MAVVPSTYAHLVLDTSVILKWFRQGEVLATATLALRDLYLTGQVTISVPSLLAYELANVLRYKSELTTEQVEQAVQSLFDMGLGWWSPDAALTRRAVTIARSHDTTVYDAAFVALAEALPAGFITADERLVQRLQDFSYVHFLGDVAEESR
jgi:predicted nucleic acid-binding protein